VFHSRNGGAVKQSGHGAASVAAQNGKEGVLRLLLEARADLDASCEVGLSNPVPLKSPLSRPAVIRTIHKVSDEQSRTAENFRELPRTFEERIWVLEHGCECSKATPNALGSPPRRAGTSLPVQPSGGKADGLSVFAAGIQSPAVVMLVVQPASGAEQSP
jgi:hypothetical protein